MTIRSPKETLREYLQEGREALLWKLDGLSEYDQRRPLVPTGTNLLGLVKHSASVEAGYFGATFGRPFPEPTPWMDDVYDTNGDMWAAEDETAEGIVAFYRRVWAHADATIEALELDAVGAVPWWSPETNDVTLHQILVHVATETHRHAGHADLVRELVDGAVGLRPAATNLPDHDEAAWQAYRDRLEKVASRFR